MKRVLQLISLLVFVVSCQGNLQLPQSGDVGLATKSSDDDFSVKIEQTVQYLSFTDMAAFTSIVGLENRFRACDIPLESWNYYYLPTQYVYNCLSYSWRVTRLVSVLGALILVILSWIIQPMVVLTA